MTIDERVERVVTLIEERDEKEKGEFSNVVAMLHQILFEYARDEVKGYLEKQEGPEHVGQYVEQLERFFGLS